MANASSMDHVTTADNGATWLEPAGLRATIAKVTGAPTNGTQTTQLLHLGASLATKGANIMGDTTRNTRGAQ